MNMEEVRRLVRIRGITEEREVGKGLYRQSGERAERMEWRPGLGRERAQDQERNI